MTLASGYFVLTPIWHEIVIGLIAFGALYLVMSRVLIPRLEKVYAERHDRIEGGFERAEQARAEAGRVHAEYRTRIGEARDEATRIRDAASRGSSPAGSWVARSPTTSTARPSTGTSSASDLLRSLTCEKATIRTLPASWVTGGSRSRCVVPVWPRAGNETCATSR